ncbi:MAG TPA: hypothetical protein VN238_03710 [Solirubrobacteraceae bacterium]|nr:hypothetical protein [Solirubrobacteraceae bacterium]
MSRAAATALAAVLLLLALAPTAAVAAKKRADPLRTLGADSPLCAKPLDQQARMSCTASGAIERPYPLDRYRYDWHIDTGVTKVDNNLNATLQWLAALLWQGVLYATMGVLLLFQWAFSLDLLDEAMRPVSVALLSLHEQTFGRPWTIAAISALAIWGTWHGLIRMRTTHAVAGIAASIALMSCAQAMIYRPAETVGTASAAVNDVKGTVLAGATSGTIRSPSQSVADASRRVFDAIVLRPWCAVQFGDVKWCLSRAPGDKLTRAERWLRYDVGSRARDAEYEMLADEDFKPGARTLASDDEDEKDQFAGYVVRDEDRVKVEMQEKENTLLRCGLIALICLGVFGWIALLGYLSVQTLLQALMALLLLMFAPVMAFLACLGEWGRQMCLAWLRRLTVAVLAGAVYALLLAIVLALASAVAQLYDLSWLLVWGVQALLLWLVFFKREELLDWIAGKTTERAPGRRLANLRHAKHLAQSAAAPAVAVAGGGIQVGRAVAGDRREERAARSDDRTRAAQSLAREHLETQARARLEDRYTDVQARLLSHDDAKEKLAGLNRRLQPYDRRRTPTAGPDGKPKPVAPPTKEEQRLIAQRKALEAKLMPRAEEDVARRFVGTADRNQLEQGQRFSRAQIEAQAEELRRDVHEAPDPGDPRHDWRTRRQRSAIPDDELRKLTDAQLDDLLHAHVKDDIDRDRALLAALPDDPELTPDKKQTRAAIQALPAEDVKQRADEYRSQRHRDREHADRRPHTKRRRP